MNSVSAIKASPQASLTKSEFHQSNLINIIRTSATLDKKLSETGASGVSNGDKNRVSKEILFPLNPQIDKSNIKETIVRVDHVYNGKMSVAHVSKTTNGISLKLPSPSNSPTVIVNKRPLTAGKLPTFLSPYIKINGKVGASEFSDVATTASRLSVLNTTQKSNNSSTESNHIVGKADSKGKIIARCSDETKENKMLTKNALPKGNNDWICNKKVSDCGAVKRSKEEVNSSPTLMEVASNGLSTSSESKGEPTKVLRHEGNSSHPSLNVQILKNGQEKDNFSRTYNSEHIESNEPNHTGLSGNKNRDSNEKSQPIVCNICDGENTKFQGHAAFKLHYNKYHCLRHCEICQSECFGAIGLHTHMIENHVEKQTKNNITLPSAGKMTKLAPGEKQFQASNVKIKLAGNQNNVPLQRSMKDIRYHQEVIPKNCNPKRYKTLHRCQECKYMTYHGQNLNRHIDSFHHKRSCSYCGVVCTGKKPLTDHLRLVHQVKISPDKFSERSSPNNEVSRYSETQKKITTTLLKRSKKWDMKSNKMRSIGNRTALNEKTMKRSKNDYKKLTAKQMLLKNLRKELHLSKDQRKKQELEQLLSFPVRNKENKQTISSKCPYCDVIFSKRDQLREHAETKHGISLHFLTQNHAQSHKEEEEDIRNECDSKMYHKINGSKRKRYSSESSHNGSTDDYDEEDRKTPYLDNDENKSPLYNGLYLEQEYGTFNCIENDFGEGEEATGDAISMECLMQKALSNVMSFATSENTTSIYQEDPDTNMVVDDDETNPTDEAFINDSSSSCVAKCLPTNEDLAAWELFRDF